jgi:hypothetical protein
MKLTSYRGTNRILLFAPEKFRGTKESSKAKKNDNT